MIAERSIILLACHESSANGDFLAASSGAPRTNSGKMAEIWTFRLYLAKQMYGIVCKAQYTNVTASASNLDLRLMNECKHQYCQ